jgi:hypothetical protein
MMRVDSTQLGEERGAVLALVVVILFVLGGLAGTAFILGFAEQRVGRKFVRYQQASAAADAGAYAPLVAWDARTYNRLAVGDSATFAGETGDGTGFYAGAVTRLGSRLFLVSAEGWSADAEVRQRAGAILQLRPLSLTIKAALETRTPLHLEPTVRITGIDARPYGWSCPAPADTLPGVRIPTPDPGSVPWSGCEPAACVEGAPPFESSTPGLGPGAFVLDESLLGDLRAVAAHVLSGGTVQPQPVVENGSCVTAAASNWGHPFDPGGPCGDHFSAIYSIGDLTVAGGQGQGVLVVEGDLTVSADFQFFGVVVVVGSFSSLGSGGLIVGAVIAGNDAFETQTLGGATRIQYSSCAVGKSLAGIGRGLLLRERSWLDRY